jgi:putative ABC transport system ATP-binding protein
MLVVENVTKNYAEDGVVIAEALRGVSLTVREGEFISIMGPSGSGKSTLLHILSFLDRPTSGSYTFFGKHMHALSDEKLAHVRNAEMGFVFQAFNLLGRSTVYENVEIPLLYASGISREERRERVRSAVRQVGLEDKIDIETAKLSGGQKQRVAIARALVTKPRVIFADEPTGNLDSRAGAQIMEILEGLNREGHTIILVTHETYTAEFARRLIHIKDGLIESDRPVLNHRRAKTDFMK